MNSSLPASGIDLDEIKGAIGEEIGSFGSSCLGRYRDALGAADGECVYWGEKTEFSGVSKLVVEINAAHSRFKRLLQSISTFDVVIFGHGLDEEHLLAHPVQLDR